MAPFKPNTPDVFGISPPLLQDSTCKLMRTDIEFLTLKELADALRVSPATVHKMNGRRALPVYRFGRRLLFRRSEVLEYLKGQRLPARDEMANRGIAPVFNPEYVCS